MMNSLNMFLICAKLKLREFCTKENGDVSIVSIVVLIGVAVILAIVFKNAIGDLITDLIEEIATNASGVATDKLPDANVGN